MKIIVDEFEGGEGVKFIIKADNKTESALLTACVDGKRLEESDQDDLEFTLTLPVSNN